MVSYDQAVPSRDDELVVELCDAFLNQGRSGNAVFCSLAKTAISSRSAILRDSLTHIVTSLFSHSEPALISTSFPLDGKGPSHRGASISLSSSRAGPPLRLRASFCLSDQSHSSTITVYMPISLPLSIKSFVRLSSSLVSTLNSRAGISLDQSESSPSCSRQTRIMQIRR